MLVRGLSKNTTCCLSVLLKGPKNRVAVVPLAFGRAKESKRGQSMKNPSIRKESQHQDLLVDFTFLAALLPVL